MPNHETEPPPHQVVDHFQFTFTPDTPDPFWCMEAVDDITMEFSIEGDDRLHQVPASFHLGGDDVSDKHVRFVPGQITTDELADFMVRGYWDDDYSSWDNAKGELEVLEQQMHTLATAALVDPVASFTGQLQELADGFFSEIPRPVRPVTVTSRDGRVTITVSPDAPATP